MVHPIADPIIGATLTYTHYNSYYVYTLAYIMLYIPICTYTYNQYVLM